MPTHHQLDNREPWQVELTADGSRTLRHVHSGITCHSASGAATECREVYVHNSGVLTIPSTDQPIRILEIGFGTGLNYLLTADAFRSAQRPLAYTALEQQPINPEWLPELAYEHLLNEPGIVAQLDHFLKHIEASMAAPGNAGEFTGTGHSLVLPPANLELWLGDALAYEYPESHFHAVYHDPFEPDVDSLLWQPEYLERLFHSLLPGGRLVSYCVKSRIQRWLNEIGYLVDIRRGPRGGKRQVLVANRPA